MNRVKIVLAVLLSSVAGIGSAVIVNGPAAQARVPKCANDFCGPGETKCTPVINWECTLSGGCAGASKCQPDPES
jgi:hypothetical protein